jgi:hypothetical protein
MTIAFVFENVNVPAATVETPQIKIAAVMSVRVFISDSVSPSDLQQWAA